MNRAAFELADAGYWILDTPKKFDTVLGLRLLTILLSHRSIPYSLERTVKSDFRSKMTEFICPLYIKFSNL